MSVSAEKKINQITQGLIAEFGARNVQLSQICNKYLGFKTEKAALQAIQTKAVVLKIFRLRDSRDSPYLLDVQSLAELIYNRMLLESD